MQIEIEEIKKLDVRPGETLIVTLPDDTDEMEMTRVRRIFRDEIPNVHLIVTTRDVKLEVVSRPYE